MSVLSCHVKTNKLLDTCLSAYFYALNFVLVVLIAGLRRWLHLRNPFSTTKMGLGRHGIRTRGHWVRSKNADSVMCGPPYGTLNFELSTDLVFKSMTNFNHSFSPMTLISSLPNEETCLASLSWLVQGFVFLCSRIQRWCWIEPRVARASWLNCLRVPKTSHSLP